MAKDLNRYQQKIVKNYYEQSDNIQSTKLAETVTELWLAGTDKAKAKLWKQAENAMQRLQIEPARIAHLMETRDLQLLAQVVTEVTKK